MTASSIVAVVFDLDGVLVDSEPLWRRTEIDVYGRVGLALTDEQARQTKGIGLRESVDYWYERASDASWDPEEVASDIVRAQVERIRSEAEPMHGVVELVDRLRGRVKLAVASSSWHDVIDAALDRLGLREAFDVVHSAQDEARGKPAPDVYLTTAGKLAVAAAACLAIEDSPAGVRAAKAAGMRCVAVPEADGGEPREDFDLADLVVASLEELDDDALARLGVPVDPTAPA